MFNELTTTKQRSETIRQTYDHRESNRPAQNWQRYEDELAYEPTFKDGGEWRPREEQNDAWPQQRDI